MDLAAEEEREYNDIHETILISKAGTKDKVVLFAVLKKLYLKPDEDIVDKRIRHLISNGFLKTEGNRYVMTDKAKRLKTRWENFWKIYGGADWEK